MSMKIQNVKFAALRFDDSSNIRFASGMTVAGVTLTKDGRSLATMIDDIKREGKIITPLIVRKVGKVFEVGCGFRRANAVKTILQTEADSPLAKTLEEIPCQVYEDVTDEEWNRAKNDQTSLDFLSSEVFAYFRQGVLGGRSWESLGHEMYAQIGRMTGSQIKIQEYRLLTSSEERREFLKKWMNNFVNGFWRSLCDYPTYADMYLRQLMYADGILGKEHEPKVKLTSHVWTKLKGFLSAGDTEAVDKLLNPSATPPQDKAKSVKKSADIAKFQETQKKNGNTWIADVMEVAYTDGNALEIVAKLSLLERNITLYEDAKETFSQEIQNFMVRLTTGKL